MVAYNCRTNLLHWQTATIMWYWSLKPFNSSGPVDLINWRSRVCLERVSVVNFRNTCLNVAYIYQNSIWLIHLSSYYTSDSYAISGVNHILIINSEFNYIHDVLSSTANATGFSHTPQLKKIYLTPAHNRVLQPWLLCHRTVGDRANRGLQHGNGRKTQQMFKRASGDTKRIKTAFWWLHSLYVLTSIVVDQCIGG